MTHSTSDWARAAFTHPYYLITTVMLKLQWPLWPGQCYGASNELAPSCANVPNFLTSSCGSNITSKKEEKRISNLNPQQNSLQLYWMTLNPPKNDLDINMLSWHANSTEIFLPSRKQISATDFKLWSRQTRTHTWYLIQYGLTSQSTHYRSLEERFYGSGDPTNSVTEHTNTSTI